MALPCTTATSKPHGIAVFPPRTAIEKSEQRSTRLPAFVQHEVTEAEKKILGRKQLEYTAVVGYGGGTKTGKNGKVARPATPPRA